MSRLDTFHFGELCYPSSQAIGAFGDGTSYPLGVPIERVFRWLYQVKTWQINMNGSAFANNTFVNAVASSADLVYNPLYTGNQHIDEAWLCTAVQDYPRTYTSRWSANAIYSDSSTDHGEVIADIALEIGICMPVSFYAIIADSNDPTLFYPGIYLNITATATATNTDTSNTAFSRYYLGAVATGSGGDMQTIKFDDYDMIVPRLDETFAGGPGVSTSASITDVIISPATWWSHDGAFNVSDGSYIL